MNVSGNGWGHTDHGEEVFAGQGGVCEADGWGFLSYWTSFGQIWVTLRRGEGNCTRFLDDQSGADVLCAVVHVQCGISARRERSWRLSERRCSEQQRVDGVGELHLDSDVTSGFDRNLLFVFAMDSHAM